MTDPSASPSDLEALAPESADPGDVDSSDADSSDAGTDGVDMGEEDTDLDLMQVAAAISLRARDPSFETVVARILDDELIGKTIDTEVWLRLEQRFTMLFGHPDGEQTARFLLVTLALDSQEEAEFSEIADGLPPQDGERLNNLVRRLRGLYGALLSEARQADRQLPGDWMNVTGLVSIAATTPPRVEIELDLRTYGGEKLNLHLTADSLLNLVAFLLRQVSRAPSGVALPVVDPLLLDDVAARLDELQRRIEEESVQTSAAADAS